MSKKAKIILIISVSLAAVIAASIIGVMIASHIVIEKNLSASTNNTVKRIDDYSRYEDENEESQEAAIHENPESAEQDLSDIELPEDFSFKVAWGIDCCSYYNSKTGKMIREIHEDEVEKYTKYMLLSEYELKMIYKLLFIDTDITTYPDKYSFSNADSSGQCFLTEPHRSFKITVFANGIEKTVVIENITDVRDRTTPLIKSIDSILDFITTTPEWQAFPATTVRYM